eukprot:scaffold92393_cov39-Phaeocystis_antarctica.AAC.1
MKLLFTHEIKARAMARALPRGTTSSAMQVQIRTNVRLRARDEIQLSQGATQAANREGSGDSLRLTPDWLRTGYSNGRGE